MTTPANPQPATKDLRSRPIQVEVRGQGGYTVTGTLFIDSLTAGARARRALRTFAILFGLAVVSVPIPPIHWLLVPGFLIASIVMFFVRLATPELLRGDVPCPKCHTTFPLESQPPTWPLDLTCHQCKAQLTAVPLP